MLLLVILQIQNTFVVWKHLRLLKKYVRQRSTGVTVCLWQHFNSFYINKKTKNKKTTEGKYKNTCILIFYIKFNITCTFCEILQIQNIYICILFWVLKYHVFNATVWSVRPKHVACVDGISRNLLWFTVYQFLISPNFLLLFSTIEATCPAHRDLYFACSDWSAGLTASVCLSPPPPKVEYMEFYLLHAC